MRDALKDEIIVKPFYGWGWSRCVVGMDKICLEVPEEMIFQTDSMMKDSDGGPFGLIGKIVGGDELFVGLRVAFLVTGDETFIELGKNLPYSALFSNDTFNWDGSRSSNLQYMVGQLPPEYFLGSVDILIDSGSGA